MTDQSMQLQQFLSNSGIQEAVQSIGPMPFLGTGWTPVTPLLDPNAVASEIFGVRVDLGNRTSLLDALKRSFPMQADPESGKIVVGHRPTSESLAMQTSGWPLVGPLATAAAALQALSNHAQGLDNIRPLNPCAGDTCDHGPLIILLIRRAIEDLVRQFATGRPLVQNVDVLLATLSTETCKGPVVSYDPDVARGYVGELGERCGIELRNVCSIEHEKIYTNFASLVALTRMFADAWSRARGYNDGTFLTISLQDLHRHLFAIVGALGRLRELVTPAAWATTEIDDPPIVAAEFWNWMHRYSGMTAPAMLQQRRDGIFGVNKTMRRFADVLSKLVDEDEPAAATSTARTTTAKPTVKPAVIPRRPDVCAGVPSAFDDEGVQDVVRELLCDVQRVIQATDCDDPVRFGRYGAVRQPADSAPPKH